MVRVQGALNNLNHLGVIEEITKKMKKNLTDNENMTYENT